MAIDPIQLVKDDLEVAIALDPTLEGTIPRRIEAQIAIQGWAGQTLTDQRLAYVAICTTKALLPRVISKFLRLMQEVKGGPAEAKYVDAIKALELLQDELSDAVKAAAKNVDPADATETVALPTYPDCGMVNF